MLELNPISPHASKTPISWRNFAAGELFRRAGEPDEVLLRILDGVLLVRSRLDTIALGCMDLGFLRDPDSHFDECWPIDNLELCFRNERID